MLHGGLIDVSRVLKSGMWKRRLERVDILGVPHCIAMNGRYYKKNLLLGLVFERSSWLWGPGTQSFAK